MDAHFLGRRAQRAATDAAILDAARSLGGFAEEPKKTSIHLVRVTAFAGVATQKAALVLTLKSDRDGASQRFRKREKASAIAGTWRSDSRHPVTWTARFGPGSSAPTPWQDPGGQA